MNPFSNASNPSKQMRQDLTALLGPAQCLFDMEDRWTYAFDAGADQAITRPPAAIKIRQHFLKAIAAEMNAVRNIPGLPNEKARFMATF